MCVAIVVASGVGSRMGADNPKQFVEVYGKPFFLHASGVSVSFERGFEDFIYGFVLEG